MCHVDAESAGLLRYSEMKPHLSRLMLNFPHNVGMLYGSMPIEMGYFANTKQVRLLSGPPTMDQAASWLGATPLRLMLGRLIC